jgi:hypothetical protein
MRFQFKAIPAALVFVFAATVLGQAPADPAAAVVPPSAILRPALANVQSTTAALNISKWKLPGDVRKATEQDVDSIQRDLGSTLPGLMAEADAAPSSVPPSFAVYRNVDALYDVLLRVSQKADLSASSQEATSIASSLRSLEVARSQLANSILSTAQRHEARIVALESAVRTANAAPESRKKESVITDGPEKKPTKKARHRTTTHKKPAPKTTDHPS